MKSMKWLWQRILAPSFLGLWLVAPSQAEDTYDSLTIGTNTLKNVRVIQASPVDLLVGHEDGFKRIKLQDLPDSLKSKYPYDARKAADYEKQKVQEARARQAQNAASVRATLLQREESIRARLKPLETELKRLNQDIGVQDKRKKGKGVRSADRKYADELRARKMAVRDQIWALQDDLERTEAQRRKFE
jgi:hypothetical protein